MFTGLIQELGTVEELAETPDGVRLTITAGCAGDLAEGDSVAVNGVCLTATRVAAGSFGADVMHETLRRSALRVVAPGARVNVELALRAADRMGGHVVQGHVDGTGRVVRAVDDGFARLVTVAPDDPALLRYVVEKGSIAVDGVSLTVASLDSETFTVSLIPETLQRTSLGAAAPGTPVNLEVDVLAKYVEKLVASR